MKSHFLRLKLAAGLCGVGLALGIAFAVVASAAKAGQPTATVTVNLASVLEKLDQRADSEAGLKLMLDKMEAEEKRQKGEITDLQKQVDDIKEETDARRKLQEKLAMSMLEYQAWARFTTEKVDIERSLILQDLYRSIKTAAAQMASQSGYDVVLVDDSQGELTTNAKARVSREVQVRQQIAGRRLLYSNPAIDITDELITRMNNAHKAGVTVAPTTPTNSKKNP